MDYERMPTRSANPITYFAQSNFRNEFKTFGIKQPDRLAHIYIIGKAGTGKTTLIETLISQDMEPGLRGALLDRLEML